MSLSALNRVAAGVETATRADEFITMAKLLVGCRWDLPMAARRAPSGRIESVLRSVVSTGSMATAAPLVEYNAMVSAFLGSLSQLSAFDTMLPSMRRVPLRTRTGVVSVAVTGASPGELETKPISSLSLVGGTLDAHKATAIIVVSDELVRAAGPDGAALFGRELRTAIATTTDTEFIALVTAGITPTPSAGASAANAWADLQAALGAVDTDVNSRLFILVEPSTARAWSMMGTSGLPAFPDVTPSGGKVGGVPVLVSGGLASGTIVVVDANAVAGAADTLLIDSTREVSIQMSSTPDSPPTASTTLVSLWQTNSVGMKAERYFGAELLRSNGAAVISSVSY